MIPNTQFVKHLRKLIEQHRNLRHLEDLRTGVSGYVAGPQAGFGEPADQTPWGNARVSEDAVEAMRAEIEILARSAREAACSADVDDELIATLDQALQEIADGGLAEKATIATLATALARIEGP